ncbi:MAG: hypothetical protein ACXQS8_00870, partial [Candidatus Helarchaeales archaeon]
MSESNNSPELMKELDEKEGILEESDEHDLEEIMPLISPESKESKRMRKERKALIKQKEKELKENRKKERMQLKEEVKELTHA